MTLPTILIGGATGATGRIATSALAEMQAMGQMSGTNDAVEKITGRKPETVAQFIEKHREAWL